MQPKINEYDMDCQIRDMILSHGTTRKRHRMHRGNNQIHWTAGKHNVCCVWNCILTKITMAVLEVLPSHKNIKMSGEKGDN